MVGLRSVGGGASYHHSKNFNSSTCSKTTNGHRSSLWTISEPSAPYIYPIKILKYRVKGNFAVDLKYQSFVFFCGGCKFCLGERLDEEIYIGGKTKKVKRNHEERNKNIIECCRVGW